MCVCVCVCVCVFKGLISEKNGSLYTELTERAEAAAGKYSVTGDSLQYIIMKRCAERCALQLYQTLTAQNKCFVQLTCHIFIIFILCFKSSILNKLKNKLSFETK